MNRTVLRIGLIVIGLVVLVVAASGGLWVAYWQHFYFDPPKADYPKPVSALEAQRQDVDYFGRLMALDRSFTPDARIAASRRLAELQRLSAALPQQNLHVALMQIMALADNGHTKMRAGVEGRKVLMAPLRIAPFAEGFFVMRARSPYRDMLGGRLESIDDVPFDAVLKAFESLRGGTQAFRRSNAAAYIADQELMYGLGIAREPDRSAWTVRLPDGRTVTHILVADAEKDQPQFTYGPRWRSPQPEKDMGRAWVAAVPANAAPTLSEENMDTLFFRAAVPGSCALYVRIESIEDAHGQQI